MAESSSQLFNILHGLQKQKDSVTKNPFVGIIDSVNPRSEKMHTQTPLQTRDLDFAHPFVSNNSWIRATPQPGTRPVIAYRSDRFQPVVLRYYQEDGARRVEDYFAPNKTNVYRPLRPGEIEIASSGFAQHYFADRAVTERRAGVIRDWLNQDELEYGQKSPLHVKQLADYKTGTIANEQRFGVVKRHTSPTKTFFPKVDNNYAKEVLLNLKSYDSKNLLDLRQGQVTDDKGAVLKHTTTSKPLRLRNLYYTKDQESLKVELDEIGNLEVKLPSSADEGMLLKVPGGGLKLQVNKDLKVDGQAGFKALFKNEVLIEANGARLRMADGKVAFGSTQGSTELVDLIAQAFEALAQANAAGGGAPLSTNSKFSELANKINQIKGTL